MDFLIKFASEHESFRVPEIEALAIIENLDLKIKEYDREVRRKATTTQPLISKSHPHSSLYSLHSASSNSPQ